MLYAPPGSTEMAPIEVVDPRGERHRLEGEGAVPFVDTHTPGLYRVEQAAAESAPGTALIGQFAVNLFSDLESDIAPRESLEWRAGPDGPSPSTPRSLPAQGAGRSEWWRWAILAVLKTLLVLFWSRFLLLLARILLRRSSLSSNRFRLIRSQTLTLFENLALVLIVALAAYLIFSAWDIDMTAWFASAGIAGIAIGFAAKDTLANLFSGVFILADAPYKIGDFVVLDSGERGRVTHIGIRSTRLLTRDDVEVTIPNSIMGNSKIINESGGPYEKHRVRVQVAVAYGSDVDRVREVLMGVATSQDGICEDPEPRVRFRSFGPSGLDFELLCWIDEPVLRGWALDALNTAVYKRFAQEGIEIPLPKQDLYIKEMPEK